MNPYLIIALMVAWAGSLLYAYENGGDARETAIRAEVLQRDNRALSRANAEIQALQESARAQEAKKAQAIADISNQHQKEIRDAESRRRADVDAARRGSLVLRDPSASSAAVCGPSEPAQVAASTGQRDDRETGQLSGQATEFLLNLVNEADEVVRQLTAAQDIIRKDRE